MLKFRLIYGLIFALLLLALLWADTYFSRGWPAVRGTFPPGALMLLLMMSIIPPALREMQGLLEREKVTISWPLCLGASWLCVVWPWLAQVASALDADHARGWEVLLIRTFRTVKPHYLVPTVLAAVLVGAFFRQSRHRQVDGAMASAGGALLSIVYLGVLPSFFLPVCLTYSAWMLLGIIAVVKSADIGAYAVGRMVGRHKLIPWLSPGKTREGFVGGVFLAGLVGILVARQSGQFGAVAGFSGGLLLGIVGQIGDLFESLLKRDAGVKDSGRVPGFGGILDLLDSPLLAAPVAYWLLKLSMVRFS